jgi:hypothetical protein
VHIVFSYHSLNVAGGAQTVSSVLATLVGLAALVTAYWRSRDGKDSLRRSFLLVTLAVLISGKVFSPQYLLWLLPIATLAEGLRLRWLLISALVFGIMHYYLAFLDAALPGNNQFLTVIWLRNLVLLVLLVSYLSSPGDLKPSGWPTTSLLSFLARRGRLLLAAHQLPDAARDELRMDAGGAAYGEDPNRVRRCSHDGSRAIECGK